MGFGGYDSGARMTRSASMGYTTKSVDQIFTQSVERKSHDLMKSQGVNQRECVDSEDHPNTVPIILGLDVTGSMGHIPHSLIQEGLPKLMGNIIEKGCPDASLLFLAIGDSRCDSSPLQIGQFEASDELLDMWLTRSYLENGGGGNGGESYALAWEFAGKRTKIDSFDKRGQRGILITVGNEACHKSISKTELEEVYGKGNSLIEGNSINDVELLAAAQIKWNVFHINVGNPYHPTTRWKELLGENFKQVDDYLDIPDIVAKIVLDNTQYYATSTEKPTVIGRTEVSSKPQELEIL